MKALWALLIVLGLEYGARQGWPVVSQLTELRVSGWLGKYLRWLTNKLELWALAFSKLGVLIYLVVPLLAVTISLSVVTMILGTVGWVILTTAILYYCLWHIIETKEQSVFVSAHEQVFALLFWFALIGPLGVVCYWLIAMANNWRIKGPEHLTGLETGIQFLHGLLAWIPARITGFIYALMGDFVSGYQQWCDCVIRGTLQSSEMLSLCGQAALGTVSRLKQEELLINRACAMWVALCILIILVK